MSKKLLLTAALTLALASMLTGPARALDVPILGSIFALEVAYSANPYYTGSAGGFDRDAPTDYEPTRYEEEQDDDGPSTNDNEFTTN